MNWIAPSEKDTAAATLEKRLGCRGPVPRQHRPQVPGILRARPRPYLPARRGAVQLPTQPPRALLDHFSDIVAPSFCMIQKRHLQIQNLRRTRDLLLPCLLSGQVELKTEAA
jgi:hypothetical protein